MKPTHKTNTTNTKPTPLNEILDIIKDLKNRVEWLEKNCAYDTGESMDN